MAVLYNPRGQAIAIPDQEWRQALSVAQQHGWQPVGTAPPPVALDSGDHSEWSGEYHRAAGQEVRWDDAGRLAEGLATAIASQADAGVLPDFTALIDFMAQSGFILCAEPRDGARAEQLFRLAEAIGSASPSLEKVSDHAKAM